jgi:ParB-like nuclease domain
MVRKTNERYQLVHGERRFRACQLAGLKEIPAIVREGLSDEAAFRLSLIENVQRENLTPMEEARSYKRLSRAGHTQADIGKMVSKSQSYVAHKLRLLTTPTPLTHFLESGTLTENHLRQALRLKAIVGKEIEDGAFVWGEASPTKVLDEEFAFILSAHMRPYGVGVVPMARGEELTSTMQKWWDYVSKHNSAPPLWERLAFWYLCYMAGNKCSVASSVVMINKFEDTLYSNVASAATDLKEEFGGTRRNPWGPYKWAIYHDLKHAGVWNALREDSGDPGLRLQLRGLDHVLKMGSRQHPSAVWAGEVEPTREFLDLLAD